jgi:hypothetical protein
MLHEMNFEMVKSVMMVLIEREKINVTDSDVAVT